VICDFGDVVVVPFPFVDVDVVKRRPALVLSNAAFNDVHGQSICAMITTGARSAWPSDVAIANLAAAGLAHASLVRWKLFTLPNELLLRRAGRLDQLDREAVHKAGSSILFDAPHP
jgi:mRNA interferase MazF